MEPGSLSVHAKPVPPPAANFALGACACSLPPPPPRRHTPLPRAPPPSAAAPPLRGAVAAPQLGCHRPLRAAERSERRCLQTGSLRRSGAAPSSAPRSSAMDGAARRGVLAALLACGLLLLGAAATPTPPAPAGGSPQDTCTSCGFRRPEEPGKVDGDFLEAVKRHILSRLQMRDRPNITHAVPKAAMVTALRKLHAGKVREDGRVEIPSLDGQASAGPPAHDPVSEIISFAETGGRRPAALPAARAPCPTPRGPCPAALPACPASPRLSLPPARPLSGPLLDLCQSLLSPCLSSCPPSLSACLTLGSSPAALAWPPAHPACPSARYRHLATQLTRLSSASFALPSAPHRLALALPAPSRPPCLCPCALRFSPGCALQLPSLVPPSLRSLCAPGSPPAVLPAAPGLVSVPACPTVPPLPVPLHLLHPLPCLSALHVHLVHCLHLSVEACICPSSLSVCFPFI